LSTEHERAGEVIEELRSRFSRLTSHRREVVFAVDRGYLGIGDRVRSDPAPPFLAAPGAVP
jgi:hypothetical protein